MSIHVKTEEIYKLIKSDPDKIPDIINDVMCPRAYSIRWDILFQLIRCDVDESLVYKVFHYYTKHDAKVLEFLKSDSIAMESITRLAMVIHRSEYNYYDIANWLFTKTYMNDFPYSFVSLFPKIVNTQISIIDCKYIRQDLDYIISCIRGNLVSDKAISFVINRYPLICNEHIFATYMLDITESSYLSDDQKIDIVMQFQRQRNKHKLTGKLL